MIRDRQTDGQTDGQTDARGKNNMSPDPEGGRHNYCEIHMLIRGDIIIVKYIC